VARPALTARGQWLRIALALPPLVGIFLLGQAILDGRAWRLDLTPERRYTLSERARTVLGTLEADVRVLAFLRAQDPRNPVIRDLLRQIRARSPRVRVDVVDVNRSPALAREYGVDSYGALVVESGGRRRVFSNPREEVLIAAVLQVTRQQRKTVAWVMGHGEGDLTSSDRQRGYATARAFLENEYYEVVPISLLADGVPVGTAVVVVAGPAKDFLPEELEALDRYLDRPGNALVMLDPLRAPGLAKRLERFAVRLLHYYSHVSFPLRNDWRSRPLPWWHPDGNHVQGSLVIALPTMPDWDDFLERIPSPEPFYQSPRTH